MCISLSLYIYIYIYIYIYTYIKGGHLTRSTGNRQTTGY